MKTKKVTRYYCEHCGKGGMKSQPMLQHERSCVRNPKRVCFLCESSLLVETLSRLIFDDDISELRTVTDCPACILASILQHRKAKKDAPYIDYDYKAECDLWHRRHMLPAAF